MIRGKQGFWLLIIIFSVIVVLVMLNGENLGMEIAKEMDGTMGLMMKKDHAAGSTLGDLFNTAWSHQAQSMSGHQPLPLFLKSVDLVGSAAILILFPLIAGASVLMIILWI